MIRLQCLCEGCENQCDSQLKSELVSKGILNYLYLNNGRKLTYSCGKFAKGSRHSFSAFTTARVSYDVFL
ncbi:MAG: hypothetical protein ACOYWZ_20325 [Bacillota bacterium]